MPALCISLDEARSGSNGAVFMPRTSFQAFLCNTINTSNNGERDEAEKIAARKAMQLMNGILGAMPPGRWFLIPRNLDEMSDSRSLSTVAGLP